MKNLKKILVASAIATSAISGGLSALSKDVVSPGGYDFTHASEGGVAWIDGTLNSFRINNWYSPTGTKVSYWHAWFWGNDQTNRTETTFVKNYDCPYYSAYSNTGYVTVVEVQTTNYFYFLELNVMNSTVSLSYNQNGGYPLFQYPQWTPGFTISIENAQYYDCDELNVSSNKEGTQLKLDWLAKVPKFSNFSWTLPC